MRCPSHQVALVHAYRPAQCLDCSDVNIAPGCREEISQSRLNRIRGIQNLDRLDESLYQDFESDEARKVRSTHVLSCLRSTLAAAFSTVH